MAPCGHAVKGPFALQHHDMKPQPRTAVLGFGNPVRSDDGIGCFVIEMLKKQFPEPSDMLSLLDMGTGAFEVLFQVQGHERIIVVDAVINTGEPDGTLYCLPASEVMGAIQDDPMVFLHSLKWDQALSYTKKIMGHAFPTDIVAYLVAISNTRLEVGLSQPVQQAGLQLAQRIAAQLPNFTPAA